MKTATILFAIGLICVALGAGLFQFVIIGLLGLALLGDRLPCSTRRWHRHLLCQ